MINGMEFPDDGKFTYRDKVVTTAYWWLRSANTNNTTNNNAGVVSSGGALNNNNVNNNNIGVSPDSSGELYVLSPENEFHAEAF